MSHSKKADRCPTCKQPIRKDKPLTRKCYKCKEFIRLHHKYRLVDIGEGIVVMMHRHCDNPASYLPLKES